MNLGEIRSAAKTYLMNDSSDTASLSWSDAELDTYINEAAFYVQQITEFQVDTANIPAVSSNSTYQGPANQYQFIRMTFDRFVLPQTNEYELDRDLFSNWRTEQPGIPERFFLPQFNQITLYPIPKNSGTTYTVSSELGIPIEVLNDDGGTVDTTWAASAEVGTIIGLQDTVGSLIEFETDPLFPFDRTYGDFGTLISFSTDEGNLSFIFAVQPDTLVNDSDIPQLPAFSHFALVQYTVMRALAREGEFQDLNLAQAWFTAFSDWMEATLEARGREWPTRVKTLEPYETGNIFVARLRDVGVPGCIQKFGAP